MSALDCSTTKSRCRDSYSRAYVTTRFYICVVHEAFFSSFSYLRLYLLFLAETDRGFYPENVRHSNGMFYSPIRGRSHCVTSRDISVYPTGISIVRDEMSRRLMRRFYNPGRITQDF